MKIKRVAKKHWKRFEPERLLVSCCGIKSALQKQSNTV